MTDSLSVRIRNSILQIALEGQEGHIGSSFSIVEILIALFTASDQEMLRKEHTASVRKQLETFVLSKGHAALALYAVMLESGIVMQTDMVGFASTGSRFGGHPTRMKEPPIPVSTGSLGHGLPVAAGMAFAASQLNRAAHFVCLCGDGELNEGSIWESFLLINKFRIGNLTVVVDSNGSSTRAIDLGDIASKLRSFGLLVQEVDGHDVAALRTALAAANGAGVPTAIVANTIKGYGSSVTANNFAWHHRVPTALDIEKIQHAYYI
jgi:transketolase